MRIKPNGNPIPRPIPSALGFAEFEGVVGEVLVEFEDVDVIADRDVVGEFKGASVEDVEAPEDVESCTGFLRRVPTGILNAFPSSQQVVPFGPQQ
jgi:hypothetical protein